MRTNIKSLVFLVVLIVGMSGCRGRYLVYEGVDIDISEWRLYELPPFPEFIIFELEYDIFPVGIEIIEGLVVNNDESQTMSITRRLRDVTRIAMKSDYGWHIVPKSQPPFDEDIFTLVGMRPVMYGDSGIPSITRARDLYYGFIPGVYRVLEFIDAFEYAKGRIWSGWVWAEFTITP